MREFRRVEESIEQQDEALIDPRAEQPTVFDDRGPFPPVSDETDFEQHRTPGTLAFDGDHHAKQARDAAEQKETWEVRTLAGRFGTYTVRMRHVKLPKEDGSEQPALKVKIDMQANDKAGAQQIGFLQVVRHSENDGKTWATTQASKQMTSDRINKTDEKTGFRVDRADGSTTPFYGVEKNNKGKYVTGENAQIGRAGGALAQTTDRPWITPHFHMEFISTATDLDTGAQYDAIRWGYKASNNKVEMIEPEILGPTDARLVGRDRAIDKWNDKMAADGDAASVPGAFNPTDVAQMLDQNINGEYKSIDSVRMTLDNPTNAPPEHRTRIKQNYQVETGHSLDGDLRKVLDEKDQKKYRAWL